MAALSAFVVIGLCAALPHSHHLTPAAIPRYYMDVTHEPSRVEDPHPGETRMADILNAQSSTFNHVGNNQYNITHGHFYPGPPALFAGASIAPPPGQVQFNDAPVDNLSIHFTGRKSELALIEKAFERRRDIPLRCALFGNQGVGKSQLTYSWAKSTFVRKENAYIMWISATTVEKLFQGFSRLLRLVDHPQQSHSDQNVRLEAARRWLEEADTGNWLLVFDNVFPETIGFLRQHLPRVNGRGTILFTTRTRAVADAVTGTAGERHQVIEVPLLDVKAGVELFCAHFDSGTMDPASPQVEAIVMAVGCLPLAISHAAGYMNESRSSLGDMLELYQSRHKIDVISWEHTLSEYEHKSVAATFASQLQDLDLHFPDASKLLRVLSFFDPESIPLEMIITGAKAIAEAQEPPAASPLTAPLLACILSPITRQNAITQLHTRCLVSYHAGTPTLRIHDLIQLIVLENTRSAGSNQQLFEFAVALAYSAFREIKDPQSPTCWPRCELLIPHIQSLTLRQDISVNAKKALLLANHRRGRYLHSRGRYEEAQSLYLHVLADREQLFVLDDVHTLAVMQSLAMLYMVRGRYVDAETSFERVLSGRKTQLGPEHRDTLWTMYSLAHVYIYQTRYDDAETLLRRIHQSQVSRFGSEDYHTLWTMRSLAIVYSFQKRYIEAQSLLTQVLEARERLSGSGHLHTLDAKRALAGVYLEQKQYNTAAQLLHEVLGAWEQDLGSQHPDTLIVADSLACVYASQGRYGDAENLFVRVLASRERILGLSHPDTQNAAALLARVHRDLGRPDEARILEQRFSPSSS